MKNSRILEKELERRIRQIFDDDEYVLGIKIAAYDDEDRQTLIDFIDKGEDVTVESVLVISLNLCDLRDEYNAEKKHRHKP